MQGYWFTGVKNEKIEVFLCHPGGPFYKNKDNAVWTIPKGEFDEDEEPLLRHKREFKEETGTGNKRTFYFDETNKIQGWKKDCLCLGS